MSNTGGNTEQPNLLAHRHAVEFQSQIDKLRTLLPASSSSPSSFGDTLSESDHTTADIKVLCRIRPYIASVDANISPFGLTTVRDRKVVYLHEPTLKVNLEPVVKNHEFIFDAAFDANDTNDRVYNVAGQHLVEWALSGGTGVCMAYGQTGSGKTFSMMHVTECVGRDLFASPLVAFETPARKIKVSVVEILGNTVTDLLPANTSKGSDGVDASEEVLSAGSSFSSATLVGSKSKVPQKSSRWNPVSIREQSLRSGETVQILEDPFGHVQIYNATVHEPRSAEEYLRLVSDAFKNRSSASTKMNESGSSRSHAVVKIAVQNLVRTGNEDGVLYLVDLAGSERHVDRAEHGPERLKETKAINTSLMVLKDCIRSRAMHSATIASKGVAGGPRIHVPFRNSKITLLLKDMFDLEARRPSKCVVIACCSPVDVAHSLNTLRYAGPLRVGLAKNGAKSDAVAYDHTDPGTWTNEQLRGWIVFASNGAISPDAVCSNNETGMQLLKQTENNVVERILAAHPNIGEKRAKAFYGKLWKMMIDARTARRNVSRGTTKVGTGKAQPQNKSKNMSSDSEGDGMSLRDKAAKEAAEIRRKMEEKRREREAREASEQAAETGPSAQ